MTEESLLVVIPCRNEAAGIESLLVEIAAELPEASVVVIDDGSMDDTADLAASRARVVRLPLNLGIGGAVQTGIRVAAREGFAFCVQVDGDGQHPPSEVRRLLSLRKETGANIVIGSRFKPGPGFRSSAARRLGIRIISAWLRLLFGVSITDPTSGLRLFDRRAIELFERRYPHDFPEPISIALAVQNALRVRETTVTMRPRAHGRSSIAGWNRAGYMIRVLGTLILIRLGGGRPS